MLTTISSSVIDASDRPPGQPVSWRRLMRVARIEHRAALITILVAFVGLVGAIVIGRDAVNSSYAGYLAAGCARAHPINLAVCANTANTFADIPSFTPIVISLRLFPLVIGAFIGAPLIAREMEMGTFRFAWTQGVGRTCLFLVTLAMLALVVTLVAVVLGLLLGGWYVHPWAVINPGVGSQWQASLFTTTWWMTPVWTLFALTLGALVGAVIKRTVAAVAASALIVGGVLLGISQVLPRILDLGAVASSRFLIDDFPIGVINANATRGFGPVGSYLVRGWFTGPGGQPLAMRAANMVRDHAVSLYEKSNGYNDPHAASRWLTLHHYTYWLAYQPANHFWILQAVVGLIVLALTALFAYVTVWRIRGRRASHSRVGRTSVQIPS